MPAPFVVLAEIEELELDHNTPWTYDDFRRIRGERDDERSWTLVAKGEVTDAGTVVEPTEG